MVEVEHKKRKTMKKTIIFASVALATLFAFSSCQKESLENNYSENSVRVITATFENNGTKTTLSTEDNKTPLWEKGDKIRVFGTRTGGDQYDDIELAAGDIKNDGKSISFTTTLTGTLYAVYPASATTMTSCSGSIDFTIPAVQDGTFASANICVAKSTAIDGTNKDNLVFRNATAVLEIKTASDVVKVEVAAENNIAGAVTASFSGNEISLTPALTENAVSAQFESATSDNTFNIFYFAVAPVTTGKVTITCHTSDNKQGSETKESKVLRSNVIYFMDLSSIKLEESCIAAGTMITMGNGAQKVVEEIEIGDVICTVDHETGTVSSAPVCFVWKTENVSNAFTLTFEGGTEVTVIEEHGFFDQEERRYAFINAQNTKDYIGHHFYDADNDRWLELKSCKTSNESVDAYAIITSKHLNHLSNGILSMCDGSVKILGLANMFEYDSHLMFDADKKKADIEKYGLTPLEKVLEYKGFLETDYYDYNLQYLNVAIGKGLTTWDYVKVLSDYCEANGIY